MSGSDFDTPPAGAFLLGWLSVVQQSTLAQVDSLNWCGQPVSGPCSDPSFIFPLTLASQDTVGIAEVNANGAVVGTQLGYDNPKPTVWFVSPSGQPTNLGAFGSAITALTPVDSGGSFLVGEQDGKIDLCATSSCTSPPTFSINGSIVGIGVDTSSNVWIASSTGVLATCTGGTIGPGSCTVAAAVAIGSGGVGFSDLVVDSAGNAWLGTTTGDLWRCSNPEGPNCVEITNSPPDSAATVAVSGVGGSEVVYVLAGATSASLWAVPASTTSLVEATQIAGDLAQGMLASNASSVWALSNAPNPSGGRSGYSADAQFLMSCTSSACDQGASMSDLVGPSDNFWVSFIGAVSASTGSGRLTPGTVPRS